jgi:hypothetical protein
MSEPGFRHLGIDYYQGAYAETLRLTTDYIDDLRTLITIFRSVREDRTIDLASWPGAQKSENVLRILLRRAARRTTIRKLETAGGAQSFEWTQDGEDWLESAELIEPMIDSNRPCHQYLTEEGEGKILVEVAFQEG